MSVEAKLTAIADAVRDKSETTKLLNLDEIADSINALEIADKRIPESFILTDDCNRTFQRNRWNWFIDIYGDKITTDKISNAYSMFLGCTELKEIPFELNFATADMEQIFWNCKLLESIPDIDNPCTSYRSLSQAFYGCEELKTVPYIYNVYPNMTSYLFKGCYDLTEIPEDYFNTWNMARLNTYSYASMGYMFNDCYSIRYIPPKALHKLLDGITVAHSGSSIFYYWAFRCCYCLDEIIDLPVITPKNMTSNMFTDTFYGCSRAKEITFEMPNGAPKVATWKNQTIDLSNYVGYVDSNSGRVTNYNSGITFSKCVLTNNAYNSLKNDKDWFTTNAIFSRYNHDSAVNTINSLPDTSAYLASAGGTNTIKFKGSQGSNTDGGAINKLTAEEIAVATAKGWTVTLV